jgi:hypothetical protein
MTSASTPPPQGQLQRRLARRPSSVGRSVPSYSAPPAECVSKHRDRPYQAGRSKHWLKVKTRKHPAMYRVMDALA